VRLPYRILVADDLADNRQLLDEMLTAAGAAVVLACDGLQAVELAEQAAARGAPFDVVLMDIQMPNLDGYGALELLRERGFEQPVIALTAHAMDADRERCEAAGFDDHAGKPIRRAELLAAISSQAQGGARLAAPRRRPTGSTAASAAQEPEQIGLWERLVSHCLPPERRQSEEARRQASLVLAVALAPLPTIPLWAALLVHLLPADTGRPLAALILFSIPLLLTLPVALRLVGSTTTATHGLLAYGYVLFGLLTFHFGGPLAPFSYWNLLIPMVALPLVGGRAAAGWTLLCVAQTYGFYFLAKSAVELPQALPLERLNLVSLVGISTLMTLSMAFVLIFERAKDEAIRTLAAANVALGIARDAADQANRTKSEFLANISHEIRTPMTAIFGYSEMLVEEWREEQAPGSMIRAVATIQRNGQHLLGLINELLDLSKIEAGRLEVEHIRFSPGRLVLDVVALMQIRAEEKGLELACEFRTPIPEQIEGDPTRLRQVLLNLVGNAVKFTDHGQVALEVAMIRTEEDSRLRFAVRDTGIGIHPDDLASLFQPFQCGDARVARAYGGTGLGLAISRNLCELMGGEILVDSEPGVGSCFRFGLPTGDLAGVRLVDDPAIPEADFEADADLDYSILLAEDGPDNQRLIAHMLRRVGMTVDIAENGQVAVEKVLASLDAEAPYDAVLMDMQMPVLDGYRAAAALRERGYTGPIIALTAHAVADERSRCLAAGCDEFATKPIDRRRLIAAIRHWVRTRKADG
jgi:signal transduction histidine kinase/DNA-binding response OmpR family regulator